MAQTAVYSVNLVGYINKPIPQKLSMIANQLNASPNNKVTTLFGTPVLVDLAVGVPGGLTINKFNGVGYDQLVYDNENGWQGPPGPAGIDMVLNPGGGAFIDNASGAALPVTFVGEVQLSSALTITPGQQVYSSVIPQSLPVTALGIPVPTVPVRTLNITRFNPATQSYLPGYSYELEQGGWLPEVPTPGIAESFFIDWADADQNNVHQGNLTWTRTFPVGP